jgi:hypothetical protein
MALSVLADSRPKLYVPLVVTADVTSTSTHLELPTAPRVATTGPSIDGALFQVMVASDQVFATRWTRPASRLPSVTNRRSRTEAGAAVRPLTWKPMKARYICDPPRVRIVVAVPYRVLGLVDRTEASPVGVRVNSPAAWTTGPAASANNMAKPITTPNARSIATDRGVVGRAVAAIAPPGGPRESSRARSQHPCLRAILESAGTRTPPTG